MQYYSYKYTYFLNYLYLSSVLNINSIRRKYSSVNVNPENEVTLKTTDKPINKQSASIFYQDFRR